MKELLKYHFSNFQSIFENTDNRQIDKIYFISSIFYLFVFYLAIQGFSPFNQTPGISLILKSYDFIDPLWPLDFVNKSNFRGLVSIIFLGFLCVSSLSIILGHRYRILRILLFVFYFYYLTVIFSFGKIDHYHHVALISSFLLIFLPNSNSKTRKSKHSLYVFWYIQFFILLTYTSSGIFKMWGIIDQAMMGEITALNPEALAIFSAKTSIAHNEEFFMTGFILDNSGYVFSVLLIAAYLIELISVLIAFLPGLHRIWGLILILFHSLNLLLIGADFSIQVVVLGLFLVFSPFHQNKKPILYPYIKS